MDEDMKLALDALERLLKMFTIERYVYLSLSIISFGLLVYFSIQVYKNNPSPELMMTVFGGGGLIAFCSVRATLFFNRAFSLFERLIFGMKNEK